MPPQLVPPENATEINAMSDELQLENFGYKQELKRSFSLFGMVGFAFSVLTWYARMLRDSDRATANISCSKVGQR